MAFILDNFGPVGAFHGKDLGDAHTGLAIFSYITTDALSVVKTAGYFNELRDDVFHLDTVYVSSNQPKANSFANQYTMILFNLVPRSPEATNVSVLGKDINGVIP